MWHKEKQENARRVSLEISVTSLLRSAIYKPLAVTFAVLMLPAISWMESGGAIQANATPAPFQASGQTIGGCNTPSPANAIIQHLCPAGSVAYINDLAQFESDAVTTYLTEHNLPQSDAGMIYSLGRTDLRNEIRANMLAELLAIVNKAPGARSTHEQSLYNWLQGLVQQNEIAMYNSAISQYNSWKTNPCDFKLDPTIASQYQLSYNGEPFCVGLGALAGAPPVPNPNYFMAYGLENSYGAPAQSYSNFGALVSGTQINLAEVAGIGAAAGTVIATALGGSIAGFFVSIFPQALGTVAPELFIAASGSEEATAVLAQALEGASAPAYAVLGPVVIVLLSALVGVTAGFEVFSNEQSIQDLNNLTNLLAQATNNPPNLSAFANDSTGLGLYKLTSSLVAQTAPDIPSTAALPAYRPGLDPQFVLESTGSAAIPSVTLTYTDWNGVSWTAQNYAGWFVQTCNSGTNCPQADSISGSLNYVDPNGVKYTASLIGNNFVSTKNGGPSTDTPCPADPTTGVTTKLDVSKCSSFVSWSIQMMVNGQATSVSLGMVPVITSSATPSFTPGSQIQSFTITAAGVPAPSISMETALPSGFSFQPGNGTAQLVYSGAQQGTYQATVTATTAGQQTSQTLTITVAQALSITSPSTFTIPAWDQPVNFTMTTTGALPITWTFNWGLPAGLSFTPNSDGTATISGTPGPSNSVPFCKISASSPPCGITASNATGSVTQQVGFNLPPVPAAQFVGPSSASFEAGTANSVTLQSVDAISGVTWDLPGTAPSWLSITPGTNGTAVLSGTPPAGSEGTYPLVLVLYTAGLIDYTNGILILSVVDTPVFLTADTAEFTVGINGSYAIQTNDASVNIGNVSLPQGLTFSSGNPATISGTPAPNTGGVTTLVLSASDSNGAASQLLTLKVDEAPTITSASTATFHAGVPGSFQVTTIGYPSQATQPNLSKDQPPKDPNTGQGMGFVLNGLPSDFNWTDANPEGFRTGTATITATPSNADVGVHVVNVHAMNGVDPEADQTLTVSVLQTAAAPASSTTCNGVYFGTFNGSLDVTKGESCTFIGGSVTGSINAHPGSTLVLNNTRVGGNVLIDGGGFKIGPATAIGGILQIMNVASGPTPNQVCGTNVTDDFMVQDSGAAIQIGSTDASACAGNTFGQPIHIENNTGAVTIAGNIASQSLVVVTNAGSTTIAGNTVTGDLEDENNTGATSVLDNTSNRLICSGNTSITGGGDTANSKTGQCASF